MSSIAANPRKARVTRSQGIKLGVMRDIIPLSPVESRPSTSIRGFRHREIRDEYGFVTDVIAGNDDVSERAESPETVSVSVSDRRDAIENVRGTWVDWDGKAVRLVSDGDSRGVRGIPRKPVKPARVKSPKDPATPAPRVSADEIARIARSVGYTGPIDRRMRSLILDVIASQAQKADYTK